MKFQAYVVWGGSALEACCHRISAPMPRLLEAYACLRGTLAMDTTSLLPLECSMCGR